MSNSRNQTSPKPIIYIDIWIYDCWSTVNPSTVHEPFISLAFLALPRITADNCHNIEQTLLLSYKTQTICILIYIPTLPVRTQFVLSVYKRRHRHIVSQSVYLCITARFSLRKRKLFDFQYENWFWASYGCQIFGSLCCRSLLHWHWYWLSNNCYGQISDILNSEVLSINDLNRWSVLLAVLT